MKNIVLILILTVFGVGPSFAAPRRYPGKFPPRSSRRGAITTTNRKLAGDQGRPHPRAALQK
ncbi:hypothetical protein PG999_012850 [Apiospora kogelbergensis]|uniref:Uncharacterized protein n=1 Tax=Apiospora kogelbergensis TaxID=1337665 RepID=A0AAW0QC55_9PEZI